jgi:nucleoside-diphosphate-sugar epimerase
VKVAVTGASGFIGRHVVADLLGAGYAVTTLHRGAPLMGAGTVHFHADVVSSDLRPALADAQSVVHLAGNGDVQGSFARPLESTRLNALGTLRVLDAARETGAHLVLASTQRIYRPSPHPFPEDAPLEPADPYAVAKLVAEQWCGMYARQLGLPTTVVRLFTVYGPGQVGRGTSGVVGIFLERALRDAPLEVHAEQRRDLTYVGDVARGIRLALLRPPPPGVARIYNLATGIGTRLEQLAHLVCRVVGSRSPVVPPKDRSPEGDRVADLARARRELGYAPEVDLEHGVRSTAQWFTASSR